MNNIWSDNIQGTNTLYLSRKLRFDDAFAERYAKAFGIDNAEKPKILELGCGPGALAESLHRWYKGADITALDRDSGFIAFAKRNIAGVDFIEGDAERLPFGDGSFDVTISNTVHEHIDPEAFWGEQFRVLKPGGICLCLSVRKGINCLAPCLKTTEEEEHFWKTADCDENELEKYGVGKFRTTEAELPKQMEKFGFTKISTAYAVIDLTPDDPKYPAKMAEAMIEAERQNDIEAIKSVHSNFDTEALKAVNRKYDERIRLYRAGQKQWDTAVTVTMIVRGVKRPICAEC